MQDRGQGPLLQLMQDRGQGPLLQLMPDRGQGPLLPQYFRSASIFLVSAIALAGLSPFGQVCVQFMMV